MRASARAYLITLPTPQQINYPSAPNCLAPKRQKDETMISAKTLANVFGATFILVGVLGFIPNPIVSPNGIFVVNAMHNMVHLLTGIAFLFGSVLGRPRNTTLGLGAYYVLVVILGFYTKGDMLLGVIHINAADRWLHVALALFILAAGLIMARDPQKATVNAPME